MRKCTMLLLTLAYAANACAAVTPMACNPQTIPKDIRKIEDYDIVAYNTATIDVSTAFTGANLNYFVKAVPHNKKNIVKMERRTGVLTIKADAADKFDVHVTAKNLCGNASLKFNVQIDEDKG